MGTVTKRGKRHRAQIRLNGVSESKTFPTKQQALMWIVEREAEIAGGYKAGDKTLHDMLTDYRDKVSPSKKGHAWEVKRINAMLRDKNLPNAPLRTYQTETLAAWRDARLKEVIGESFIRDLAVLSSAWETARREWKWTTANPCKDLKRPARSKSRSRIISIAEQEAQVAAMGFSGIVWRKSHEAAVAFLIALETAMRAGEVLGVDPRKHINGHVAHLPDTKNGQARDVPLSPRALELFGLVPEGFTINGRQLDAMFRKYRPAKAGYTFHDSRHTAITRLAKIIKNPFALARMVGHTDLNQTLAYYNESAAELATLLGAPPAS